MSTQALPMGATPPMVTIIVPAFNAAATVEAMIESVLAQTLTDWELWVIDDGSSDATPRLLRTWARRDARIRPLFRSSRGGPGAARNDGLAIARGEFIAFLDADDVWHPNKLQLQVSEMQSRQLDMSYCDHDRVYVDRGGWVMRVNTPDRVDRRFILRRNWILISSAMIRRSRLGDLRFKSVSHEDFVYWHGALTLIDHAERIAPGLSLVSYRVARSTRTGSKFRSAWGHWKNLRRDFGLPAWQSMMCFSTYATYGLVRAFRARWAQWTAMVILLSTEP